MASEWLNQEQKDILDRLLQFVTDTSPVFAPTGCAPKVAAIVGSRGIGKSTLLDQFRQGLHRRGISERSGGWFVTTRILDAAIVREDLGLAAAVIEELRRTLDSPTASLTPAGSVPGISGGPRFQPGSALGGDPADPIHRALKQSFELCIESALMQEESYRQIAQELAMTPGHYAKLVSDQSVRRQRIAEEFESFIQNLMAALRVRERTAPEKALQLVVLIDDLDLAEAESVRRWVRALLTHYAHENVCYVLTFDRDYLVRALSRRISETQLDLVSGRALLSKLVPPHWQLELRRWSFQERQAFRGLSAARAGAEGPALVAGSDTFADLLGKRQAADLLPVLPGRPRALEGIYRWLHALPTQPGTFGPEDILRQIALAAGEDELLRELDQQSVSRFANSLAWEEAQNLMSEAAWGAMVRAARRQEPIWGLPVPKNLAEIMNGPEPEAFLEALLDIALRSGAVTPYQMLLRMPFTRSRLAALRCRFRLPESEVLSYFSQEGLPAIGKALPWQRWPDEAVEKSWEVEIGPTAVWDFLYGIRSASPTGLLRTLYLPRMRVPGPKPTEQQDGLLPCRCRPLLLLLDGLLRAPWTALETRLSFWSPLTFTRCVAAFTLGSYARNLTCLEGSDSWFLRQIWGEPEDRFFELTEDQVRKELADLCKLLNKRTAAEPRETAENPVTRAAEAELTRSLRLLLDQPSVKDLYK